MKLRMLSFYFCSLFAFPRATFFNGCDSVVSILVLLIRRAEQWPNVGVLDLGPSSPSSSADQAHSTFTGSF